MKKTNSSIGGMLVLIAALLVAIPTNATAASFDQCLKISNVTTTILDDQISLKANASQVCSEFTPGSSSFSAYSPLYQLQPHAITCTGPNLRQGKVSLGLSGLYLGEVSCSGKSQSYGVGTSSLTAWLPLQGTILTSVVHTPITAPKNLADCIEFSNSRSSAGSTSITLEVDLYSICSKVVREYENPVYEMVEEDSLLNISSCTGPLIKSAGTLGRMYLGTIKCNLRINQVLGSARTGSTSTTIKIWFAWDFSTKRVSVTHTAIPSTKSQSAPSPTPTVQPVIPQASPTPTVQPVIPQASPTPITIASDISTVNSLASFVTSLKAVIVTLTNLVLKIQRTVKNT